MSQRRLRPPENTYLLDANVFMAAHRDHYPPDVCEAFWDCLEHYCTEGVVLSIDRVEDELLGPEELVDWSKRVSNIMFPSSGLDRVVQVFSQMQSWVQNNDQFLPMAKDEFARVADGWLAAYAKVHGALVVTQEVFNSDVKRRVPLPNLCRQFDVRCCNTLDMLRGLGVRFEWQPP